MTNEERIVFVREVLTVGLDAATAGTLPIDDQVHEIVNRWETDIQDIRHGLEDR